MNNMIANFIKTNRPFAITFICVYAFAGAVEIFWVILHPSWWSALEFGSGYILYLAFSAVIRFVCAIGLGLMKRWSFYVFVGVEILHQLVLLVRGHWSIWSILALLITGIVIYIGSRHVSGMS